MKLKSKALVPLALIAVCATVSVAAAPPEATLTVLLCDYTGLAPAALDEVESITSFLLSRAGIHIEWILCRAAWPLEAPDVCMAHVTTVRVLVRIVTHPIELEPKSGDPLGSAVINNHYATLYAGEIRTWAGRQGVSFPSLMAYAAAHEIGHLLLGPQHGSAGIMQAVWGKTAHKDISQRWLGFEPAEREAMQDRVRKGRQASLAQK